MSCFTGDWTHDAGIVGVVSGLLGYLLGLGPRWWFFWRERRDRARDVPIRRGRDD